MSNIEKIRQEIERLYDSEAPKHDQQCDFNDGYFMGIDTISNFIDSLPEEDTTEDLNELIQKWDRIDINTILKVKVKATGKVIDGFYDGRGHFDHFIDHDVFDRYSINEVELMPDEEPSKDLEEAADKYADDNFEQWVEDDEIYNDTDKIRETFIAGAKWMSKQISNE